MTPASLAKLKGVHPDLVKVVRKLDELYPNSFTVIEGVRSIERQREMVAKGASRTMRSRHLTGHAVDLGVLIGGKLVWSTPPYRVQWKHAQEAAAAVGVPIEWGGNFPGFFDGPHIQLPRDKYP